jgi:hypothetical protein
MVSLALPVPLDKTGILPPDHVDVQSDNPGMEPHVSPASVEDNGMPSQENASAPMGTGMDSHAFSVLLDRDGTPELSHAHALKTASGMVLTAGHAQVKTDSGISNLMTVFAE